MTTAQAPADDSAMSESISSQHETMEVEETENRPPPRLMITKMVSARGAFSCSFSRVTVPHRDAFTFFVGAGEL